MTGYQALRENAAWIDLSGRGEIRVNGEDRTRLLHAMSTNDVNHLPAGHGQYAFFLTAQGRIVADAYIYNLGKNLLLDTEPETRTKLCDHLDRFIIADDVTLEDETEQWAILGLEGPRSVEYAAALGMRVPEEQHGWDEWENGFVARVAMTGKKGVRIFVPTGRQTEITERLRAHGIPNALPEEARSVRLENGIPRYGEDMSERYLVHETQQLHAVHSNKGCYLGQEIVERVRSRGQVHRLLTRIRLKTATPPARGAKLSVDGEEAGEITSSAYSPALGEVVALAYMRTEATHGTAEMTLSGTDPAIIAYIAQSPSSLP